jgi:hypothetical protein
MTEQNHIRQTESESAGPQGHTGHASRHVGTESEINPYLYENLVSNLECQISSWIRKAESNPETAQQFRWKAEGLGYALRLLYVFKPGFEGLVEKAATLKCRGCSEVLELDTGGQATETSLVEDLFGGAKLRSAYTKIISFVLVYSCQGSSRNSYRSTVIRWDRSTSPAKVSRQRISLPST